MLWLGKALRAGAVGYLLKNTLRRELVDTIRDTHAGKFRVPVEVARELAGHHDENELSARELDVLRLVALGSSNKRVGQLLSVTEDTVKAHMKAILLRSWAPVTALMPSRWRCGGGSLILESRACPLTRAVSGRASG